MKQLNLKEIKKENGEKAYHKTKNETSFLEILSHPHIIKYYKNFEVDNYLYIIIEFVPNGDLRGYIKAHKTLNKHISEENLWNIFLQCIEALSYIHSKGVIHRDIKPDNILMDNNMIVKLGDFGTCALQNNQYLDADYLPLKNKKYVENTGTLCGTPNYLDDEIKNRNDYDQKVDVYSMGVCFYEMCYFDTPEKDIIKIDQNSGSFKIYTLKNENVNDKNVNYSKELLNIITLMLEKDINKKKTSEEILKLIQEEYSKKYIKNSSIDSIVRCLYSYNSLTKNFLEFSFEHISNKPMTKAYIQCLQSVSKESLLEWINSIGYLRVILCSENPKFEGTKEIEPRFLFTFFLKELLKELDRPKTLNNNNNKHLICSGEEICKTNEIEVGLKYGEYLYNKFNSTISNNFSGLMKITHLCNKCNIRTYSFNSFFFITFNLEHILKNSNIKELNIQEQFIKQKNNSVENLHYCSKCVNKTIHNTYKEYFKLPKLLIISIQRGITYNYKNPINITQTLDLTELVGFEDSHKKFKLVSLLCRKVNNDNEIFFSVVLVKNQWFYCQETNINQIDFPSDANFFGDILMLFYEPL